MKSGVKKVTRDKRYATRKRAVAAIRVGHTPDMDDAFMFYAIAEGLVPTDDLRVAHVIEDIQSLNRRAATAELEMTAASAASFPALAKDYWILSIGSSIGRGYGPVVISAKPHSPASLAGCRVAIPGLQTTAALLLRLAIPSAKPVETPFQEIPQAIVQGEVEAGLVIHEWQLTYRDAGLLPVLDLGTWWQTETKLPLPLGLNLVKRSLGRTAAQRLATILRDSIRYAFAHPDGAIAYAMRYARGTDRNRSRQFVEMYVNDDTISLTPAVRKALRTLYAMGRAAGVFSTTPRLTVIEPQTH